MGFTWRKDDWIAFRSTLRKMPKRKINTEPVNHGLKNVETVGKSRPINRLTAKIVRLFVFKNETSLTIR